MMERARERDPSHVLRASRHQSPDSPDRQRPRLGRADSLWNSEGRSRAVRRARQIGDSLLAERRRLAHRHLGHEARRSRRSIAASSSRSPPRRPACGCASTCRCWPGKPTTWPSSTRWATTAAAPATTTPAITTTSPAMRRTRPSASCSTTASRSPTTGRSWAAVAASKRAAASRICPSLIALPHKPGFPEYTRPGQFAARLGFGLRSRLRPRRPRPAAGVRRAGPDAGRRRGRRAAPVAPPTAARPSTGPRVRRSSAPMRSWTCRTQEGVHAARHRRGRRAAFDLAASRRRCASATGTRSTA